jgi:ABC-type hemin transport system substrate-binding protein
MSVEKWQAGDKITAEKMNRIIDLLNDVEVKVLAATANVKTITTKITEVAEVTDSVKTNTNQLVEEYNAKLTEVQKAYANLKDEISKINRPTRKANSK